MISTSDGRGHGQTRTYDRAESVVFLKTNEQFGGLSNMASGFPLRVNGIRIFTSEALYQACRFPHRPEVQRLIIGQASPMTAKMKSKPYRHDSRPDWDRVRVKIMRWCLRVKLAQNRDAFSELLLKTGDRPIVEKSRKDDFWGAKETEGGTLVGRNVLGRLLMELREAVKTGDKDTLLRVEPLAIPDFLLDGRVIGVVQPEGAERRRATPHSTDREATIAGTSVGATQTSLFDQPAVKEAPESHIAFGRAQTGGLTDLRPYPSMKDSSVPCLGEVPAHWEVLPGRACYREKKVPNTGMKESSVLSLSYGQIVVKPAEKLHGLVPASFETYQIVDPGDIIIRPTDLQNDWNSLRFGLSRHRGIITSAYMCFHTNDVMTREYGHLLLHAYDLKKIFYGLGSGLRQNLDWRDFKYLPCLAPPLPEQSAIVRFLDHIDRRIRRYILAKQKLIELLNEQKQAVIHRAVTRGLDPNVRLKPSGIDWLGDVPEHWEVRRLKQLLVQPLKYGANQAAEQADHEAPRYIRITDIDKNGNLVDETFRSISEDLATPYLLQDGDILLARSGATVGKTYLYADAHGRAAYAGYLIRARVDRRLVLPSYLYAFLQSPVYWSWISSITIQATIQNVSAEKYANLFIPLPQTSEQAMLLHAIADETRAMESAMIKTRREIDLVREYRTRLIADVVTGKVDVRHLALKTSEAGPEDLDEGIEEEMTGEDDAEPVEEVADADD